MTLLSIEDLDNTLDIKEINVFKNISIENNVKYTKNKIKNGIKNNKMIEEKLHTILVISNPCMYGKRYKLLKEFVKRIEEEEDNVILYIVELAYGDQKFMVTEENNKYHLQLRTVTPLWHKENMINIGVKKLLPANYKAFAWIDADIAFENDKWSENTLKILNGTCDIVQLFSHCLDMDDQEDTMKTFNSAGFQYTKNKTYSGKGENQWHPGYGWAITRKAYEEIGGLYELGILGSGDNIMLHSLLNQGLKSINDESSTNYKNTIVNYEKNMKKLKFGYIPGVIKHYYHGSKVNRKYNDRWKILVKNNYSPEIHIKHDENGLLIPTEQFSEIFKEEILNYFKSRQEDD